MKLSDCNENSDEMYNFYAVIVDATFPHKSFKSDKYICNLKIIDRSQPVDRDGIVNYSTLMLFAKNFFDLPSCQRIGDIIRVHRVQCGTYKGVRQFTANIFFNSSWAVFSGNVPSEEKKKEGERDFYPLKFSGKSFTFELSERKTIKDLREWKT